VGEIRAEIESGALALGLALPPAALDRLAAYLALIARWNKVYNLTAVREPAQMVPRHLLDALAVLPHIEARDLVDIGSGAGIPGIPIAIARPNMRVTLLESNGKKARFLGTVRRELGLENVEVVQARAESFRPAQAPDAATARAVASLGELGALARPWLAAGGGLYALKGRAIEAELAALPSGFELVGVQALVVPGLDAERRLVVLRKS
jgi:16S rRNA (guanine527-N7)-methyltransferase